MTIEQLAQDMIRAIGAARCDLSSEKRTQADIALAIERTGFTFAREVRLGKGDIPDFVVQGRLVIEAKLRGAQKRVVFRQLERYAAYDQVEGVLLVSNLSMGLPAEIAGKPAWFLSLGRAWL